MRLLLAATLAFGACGQGAGRVPAPVAPAPAVAAEVREVTFQVQELI